MSKPSLQKIVDSAFARRAPLLTPKNSLVRLIDGAGDDLPGHFLDQFGSHLLLSTTAPEPRPDLIAHLSSYHRPLYHKHLSQHQKKSPTHLSGPPSPESFLALENGLTAKLSFHSGYSQGIFLDQRDNRAALRQLIQPGQTVLNTFAYTGFFSVSAAAAGAITTTLDLSQPYLDWARENFHLNQINPAKHFFCKGDTFHWLRRFAKQGRTFDVIILDPPTFSRDDQGKVFRVEKDYPELFALALACTAPGGHLLACTNSRQLTPAQFQSQLQSATLSTQTQKISFRNAQMPPDFTDHPYLKSLWAHLAI